AAQGAGTRGGRLPGVAGIRALVRQPRGAVQDALGDPLAPQSPGGRLFDLLVAPVAAALPKNAHVIVVPDGPLYGLNLETLPVTEQRLHYWIEDAEIQVAPSLALLHASAGSVSATAGRRALLLLPPP